MKTSDLNKFFGMLMLGLTLTLGLATVSNAQNDRDRDRDRMNNNQGDRWRVRQGRTWYTTDSRGTELFRQAVREGYRQGYQAGRDDRSGRRRNSWRNNTIYRSGNMGYESYVDQRTYQYYFQQGFQKGYDDGYNSRNRYGSNNTILGNILNQIFRPQRY